MMKSGIAKVVSLFFLFLIKKFSQGTAKIFNKKIFYCFFSKYICSIKSIKHLL